MDMAAAKKIMAAKWLSWSIATASIATMPITLCARAQLRRHAAPRAD
jgi:hypothetical protein